jgi:hypothetical protein
MCFRLRRIGDLMAMKEGRRPLEHGEGGTRGELKGAWPGTSSRYLKYCSSCMGGGQWRWCYDDGKRLRHRPRWRRMDDEGEPQAGGRMG